MKIAEFDRRLNVSSITLDPDTLSLTVDEAKTMTATLLPVGHNEPGKVTWNSSDESIAIVSHDGVVTGVAEGTCTITASFGSVKATCPCTVKAATP